MEQSNRKSKWDDLERLDWQLWVFSGVLTIILGLSLLSFMFPEVFWRQDAFADSVQRKAVVGFAFLLFLVVVYIFQRQATICQLKRQLFEARTENLETQRKSYLHILLTLPNRTHFRDALAMEFRRTSSAGTSLSQVLIQIQEASQAEVGQIAAFVRSLLRGEEMIARIAETTIGLILPNVDHDAGTVLAIRIKDYLKMQLPCAEVGTSVVSYPQDVTSLTEFASHLRRPEPMEELPVPKAAPAS